MVQALVSVLLLAVPPSWSEVGALLYQGKNDAALAAMDQRLAAARLAGDDEGVAQALVRRSALLTALWRYDEALASLGDEASWPTAAPLVLALSLRQATLFEDYLSQHEWEAAHRDRVETTGPLSLDQLTLRQLTERIDAAYARAWARREALGQVNLGALPAFFIPNTFPSGVRATLRDVITRRYGRWLADRDRWSQAERDELPDLPLDALLTPSDPDHLPSHRLARAVAVFADLEAWHRRQGHPEGALAAAFERYAALRAAFVGDAAQPRVREALLARLATDAALPFSAWVGTAAVRWLDQDGQKVAARDLATRIAREFPHDVSGESCADGAAALQAPTFDLSAPLSDGPGKPSLAVSSANLAKLHFRAFTVDPATLGPHSSWDTVSSYDALQRLLKHRPVAAWTVALPATPDLSPHRTLVTPPLDQPGAYFIVASPSERFDERAERVLGRLLLITPIVLTASAVGPEGTLEVIARDGATGAPLAGVQVSARAMPNEGPQRTYGPVTTDASGVARLRQVTEYVVAFARKGRAVAIIAAPLTPHWRSERPASEQALIYTDRAIYRPGQTVHVKVVAFTARGADDPPQDFQVVPKRQLTVQLTDANGATAAQVVVTTNEFGSAHAELTIPPGRRLGSWSVRTGTGRAWLQVEEYKRPTFEVTWADQQPAATLNAPVTLSGRARYYFGQPVTTGEVRWRVRRTPDYPWWYAARAPREAEAEVASGSTTLASDGTFAVHFTPRVSHAAGRAATWRFTVEATVTEDGGESHEATRVLPLGFRAVDARFEPGPGFFRAGQDLSVAITRTALDGAGQAGTGRWRLVALSQPAAPVEWADEPSPEDHSRARTLTLADDARRPRDQRSTAAREALGRWADGPQVASGVVTHDATGAGRALLPSLPVGAYRLRYATDDGAGGALEVATELLVVDGSPTLGVAVPALFGAEATTLEVGQTARVLVGSASPGQRLLVERLRGDTVLERRWLVAGTDGVLFEHVVSAADRGGFTVRCSAVRDWAVASDEFQFFVPWTDKTLQLSLSTFRDTMQPGSTQQVRLTVKAGGQPLSARAEALALMYDASLRVFGEHVLPSPAGLYPDLAHTHPLEDSLLGGETRWLGDWTPTFSWMPTYDDDADALFDRFRPLGFVQEGGSRMKVLQAKRFNTIQIIRGAGVVADSTVSASTGHSGAAPPPKPAPQPPAPDERAALRQRFAETALFAPHLVVDPSGELAFELTAPDSVTEWNLWVGALTTDLRGGELAATLRTVKELQVRPALPRFLREGDRAALKVVVDATGAHDLSGQARIELLDPATHQSVSAAFGLEEAARPFSVKAGQSTTLTAWLNTPRALGEVLVKVTATTGELADGELRALPILPSRLHLVASRFVALTGPQPRTLSFAGLTDTPDPTRVDEQLVVKVDAQLLSTVLGALPSLVRTPYECAEQTLNRFLSTSIVASVFKAEPALARLAAARAATRTTPYEPFDALDPNRRTALEETPWLVEAQGGAAEDAVKLLDPVAVEAERSAALLKLERLQRPDGFFPWFPGGPASPAITLYVLQGLARAAEAKVEVPRELVSRAWRAVSTSWRGELAACLPKGECDLALLVGLAYTASAFPTDDWLADGLTGAERKAVLEAAWKERLALPPVLKGQLALALEGARRHADALALFDTVMNTATTTADEGTFWAPSDHAWLWYHDTVEGHAFALRVLQRLSPDDPRRAGLVQWLVLNKTLNQWKSTRASAEAIAALVAYLRHENGAKVPGGRRQPDLLAQREETTVGLGARSQTFTFGPSGPTHAQLVVPGPELDARTMSTVTVTKASPGLQFASATWHYSTDRLPEVGQADLFAVTRRYFKRALVGAELTLQPLSEGARLEPGDQLEVHLTVTAKQSAEYVHLRDPRGAGFEPEQQSSRVRWEGGLGWYEEPRDSATNFFFERVPAGTYTLVYRVRATMSGTFRVGPATLQAMYAPEFTASSAGTQLTVGAGGR